MYKNVSEITTHGEDEIVLGFDFLHAKDTVVQRQVHDFYEIVYYKTGDGVMEQGEIPNVYSNHTISFTRPHVWHKEIHHSQTEIMCIGFYLSDDLDLASGVYHDDEEFSLQKLIQEIIKECSRQSAGYWEMLQLKLQELRIVLARIKGKDQRKAYNFNYTMNFMQENYQQKLVLKDLAEACGYSYDYFRHQFQRRTGHSPQQYLMQIRLGSAKELLENTSMSCTQIAYECGFSDGAQFSSIFRKNYGVSPAKYRAKLHGK